MRRRSVARQARHASASRGVTARACDRHNPRREPEQRHERCHKQQTTPPPTRTETCDVQGFIGYKRGTTNGG